MKDPKTGIRRAFVVFLERGLFRAAYHSRCLCGPAVVRCGKAPPFPPVFLCVFWGQVSEQAQPREKTDRLRKGGPFPHCRQQSAIVDTSRRRRLSCYPVNHTGANPQTKPNSKIVAVIPARFA